MFEAQRLFEDGDVRVTTAFNRLLALPGARVTDVGLAPDGVVVRVALRRRRAVCSVCGQVYRGAARRARSAGRFTAAPMTPRCGAGGTSTSAASAASSSTGCGAWPAATAGCASKRCRGRGPGPAHARVIAANRVPDHATIARPRVRHERALTELFADVLRLLAQAGLVRVELVAVDGTKLQANASRHATRDYARIAEEMLTEADAVDREEDERYGERRGDELPPHLSSSRGRRAWLRDARRRLDDQRAEQARPVARFPASA